MRMRMRPLYSDAKIKTWCEHRGRGQIQIAEVEEYRLWRGGKGMYIGRGTHMTKKSCGPEIQPLLYPLEGYTVFYILYIFFIPSHLCSSSLSLLILYT